MFNIKSRKVRAAAMAIAMAFPSVVPASPAKADETVVICSGAVEPVTVTACVIAMLAGHELLIADKPFGKNGEIAKAGREARDWVGYRLGIQKHGEWLGKRLGARW